MGADGSGDSIAPFGPAVAAALVAGLLACLRLPELPPWPVLALAFALGVRGWIHGRRAGRLVGVALLGIGLCGLHAARTLERQLPPAFERADVALVGTVVDLPRHEPDRTAFRFLVDEADAMRAEVRARHASTPMGGARRRAVSVSRRYPSAEMR